MFPRTQENPSANQQLSLSTVEETCHLGICAVSWSVVRLEGLSQEQPWNSPMGPQNSRGTVQARRGKTGACALIELVIKNTISSVALPELHTETLCASMRDS